MLYYLQADHDVIAPISEGQLSSPTLHIILVNTLGPGCLESGQKNIYSCSPIPLPLLDGTQGIAIATTYIQQAGGLFIQVEPHNIS